LRWANIGWHYHWGSKQYDFSKVKGDVCSEVRVLCKSAVGVVDWEDVFSGPAGNLDWGQEGPEWTKWNDTYGSLPACLEGIFRILIFCCRAGRGYHQFLSNQGGRTVRLISLINDLLSAGCLDGPCGSL
jgi:hypothetical protein